MKSRKFPYKNSKEFQTKLINRAYLSVGLPLLAFSWIYLELLAGNITPIATRIPVYFLMAGFSIVILVLLVKSLRDFGAGIKDARAEPELSDKLLSYARISLQKYLYLFVASVFAVAGLYLSASELFAAWFAVIIVIFSLANPTKDRIVADLRLKDEHKKVVLKGEELPS